MAASDSKTSENSTKTENVPPKMEFDDFPWMPPQPLETTRQKFARKIKENPLVPVGVAATVAALTMGLINFNRGDSMKQQFFMRARVVAQGCTLVAVVGGLFLTAQKAQKASK